MVSIAEDNSGGNGGSGGGSGCQHYKRKCKFYVSTHLSPPLRRRPRIMKVNMSSTAPSKNNVAEMKAKAVSIDFFLFFLLELLQPLIVQLHERHTE